MNVSANHNDENTSDENEERVSTSNSSSTDPEIFGH